MIAFSKAIASCTLLNLRTLERTYEASTGFRRLSIAGPQWVVTVRRLREIFQTFQLKPPRVEELRPM